MSDIVHFIGIDPGVGGGIAWTSPVGDQSASMPATLHDTLALINKILDEQSDGKTLAYVEELPKHGGLMSSSSIFVLARNYGQCEGILAALSVTIHHVKPQAWQKALGLGSREKTGSPHRDRTKWKNKLKAKAQHLYPEENVTLDTADALLILHAATSGLI